MNQAIHSSPVSYGNDISQEKGTGITQVQPCSMEQQVINKLAVTLLMVVLYHLKDWTCGEKITERNTSDRVLT